MAVLHIEIENDNVKKKVDDLKKELLSLAGQTEKVTDQSLKKIDTAIQKSSQESATKAIKYVQKSFDSINQVQRQLNQYQSASSKVHEQFYRDMRQSSQAFSQAARQVQYSLNSINFNSIRKNIAQLQSNMTDWQKKSLISQPYTASLLSITDNLTRQVNKFIGNRNQPLLVKIEDINAKALSPLLYQIKKSAVDSATSESQKKFFKWQMAEMTKLLSSVKNMPAFQFAGQSFLDLDSFGAKATLPFFKEVLTAIKQTSKDSGAFGTTQNWDQWQKTIRKGIDSYYSASKQSGLISTNATQQIKSLSNIEKHIQFLESFLVTEFKDTNFGKRSLTDSSSSTKSDTISQTQLIETVLTRALKTVGYQNAELFEAILTNSESQILDKLLTKLLRSDFYTDQNIQRSAISSPIYKDNMKGGLEIGRMWVKEAQIQSFTSSGILQDYSKIPISGISTEIPKLDNAKKQIKYLFDFIQDTRDIIITGASNSELLTSDLFMKGETIQRLVTETGQKSITELDKILRFSEKLFHAYPIFNDVAERILLLSNKVDTTGLSDQELNAFQEKTKQTQKAFRTFFESAALIPTTNSKVTSYFDSELGSNVALVSSSDNFEQAATAKAMSHILRDLIIRGTKSIWLQAVQNIDTADIFPVDAPFSNEIVRALEILNSEMNRAAGVWDKQAGKYVGDIQNNWQDFLINFQENLLHKALILTDQNMLSDKFSPVDKIKTATKMLEDVSTSSKMSSIPRYLTSLDRARQKEYSLFKIQIQAIKHANDALEGLTDSVDIDEILKQEGRGLRLFTEKNLEIITTARKITKQETELFDRGIISFLEGLNLISGDFDNMNFVDALDLFNQKRIPANILPGKNARQKYLMPEGIKNQISQIINKHAQTSVEQVLTNITQMTQEGLSYFKFSKQAEFFSQQLLKYGWPNILDRENPMPIGLRKELNKALSVHSAKHDELLSRIQKVMLLVYDEMFTMFDGIDRVGELVGQREKAGKQVTRNFITSDISTQLANFNPQNYSGIEKEVAAQVARLIKNTFGDNIPDGAGFRQAIHNGLTKLISTFQSQVNNGINDAFQTVRAFVSSPSSKMELIGGVYGLDSEDEQGIHTIAQDTSENFRRIFLDELTKAFTHVIGVKEFKKIFKNVEDISRGLQALQIDEYPEYQSRNLIDQIDTKQIEAKTKAAQIAVDKHLSSLYAGIKMFREQLALQEKGIEQQERGLENYSRYLSGFASGGVAGIGSQIDDKEWTRQWSGFEAGIRQIELFTQSYNKFKNELINSPIMIENKGWLASIEKGMQAIRPYYAELEAQADAAQKQFVETFGKTIVIESDLDTSKIEDQQTHLFDKFQDTYSDQYAKEIIDDIDSANDQFEKAINDRANKLAINDIATTDYLLRDDMVNRIEAVALAKQAIAKADIQNLEAEKTLFNDLQKAKIDSYQAALIELMKENEGHRIGTEIEKERLKMRSDANVELIKSTGYQNDAIKIAQNRLNIEQAAYALASQVSRQTLINNAATKQIIDAEGTLKNFGDPQSLEVLRNKWKAMASAMDDARTAQAGTAAGSENATQRIIHDSAARAKAYTNEGYQASQTQIAIEKMLQSLRAQYGDQGMYDRGSNETLDEYLKRLNAINRELGAAEKIRTHNNAKMQDETNNFKENVKEGVKHKEMLHSINEAYRQAHPSGQNFWNMMAKAGMIMSGIAASMFVMQQVVTTFKAIIRTYTDIETKVRNLGETYGFTTEQQQLFINASKKVIKFTSIDSDEYIKSVENAYKKGLKILKGTKSKAPKLIEYGLSDYMESEYKKALAKTVTIETAMQRVGNAFKSVLIDTMEGSNQKIIDSLMNFSKYIQENSSSVKAFFGDLLYFLGEAGSALKTLSVIMGTFISGAVIGFGGLISPISLVVEHVNSAVSYLSKIGGVVGMNEPAEAGLAYGLIGRMFFGSWKVAGFLAAFATITTGLEKLKSYLKSENNGQESFGTDMIDAALTGSGTYLTLKGLQKFIPFLQGMPTHITTLIVSFTILYETLEAVDAKLDSIAQKMDKGFARDTLEQIDLTAPLDLTRVLGLGKEVLYDPFVGLTQNLIDSLSNAVEAVPSMSKGTTKLIVAKITDGDTLRYEVKNQIEEKLTEEVRQAFINTAESVHENPGKNVPEGLLASAFMKLLAPPGSELETKIYTKWSDEYKAIGEAIDNGMDTLYDKSGRMVDIHDRLVGASFLNGEPLAASMIAMQLSDYELDFGYDTTIDPYLKKVAEDQDASIKYFYVRLQEAFAQAGVGFSKSMAEDALGFEQAKLAILPFAAELKILNDLRQHAAGIKTFDVVDLQAMGAQIASLRQLQGVIFEIAQMPELKAGYNKQILENFYKEELQIDKLKELLVSAKGYTPTQADAFLKGVLDARVANATKNQNELKTKTEQFNEDMTKLEISQTKNLSSFHAAEAALEQTHLNNTLNNSEISLTAKKQEIEKVRALQDKSVNEQTKAITKEYELKRSVLAKEYNEYIARIDKLPDVDPVATASKALGKANAKILFDNAIAESKKLEEIDKKNAQTRLQNNIDAANNHYRTLSASSTAAAEKARKAIEREQEKDLKEYSKGADAMLSGVRKLQDEITKYEEGTAAKKIQQLDRSVGDWEGILTRLSDGLAAGKFELDAVKAVLGGKTVEQFRTEMQDAAYAIRPFYEEMDKLEDLKKELAQYSLDTSKPITEQYADVERYSKSLSQMILDATDAGVQPGSERMNLMIKEQEKWAEKSKSIYDKISDDGKTAFSNLYKDLQDLGEYNLQYQQEVLDLEFAERASKIADYMWTVKKASAEEILIVLDKLNKIKELRTRDADKAKLESEGMFGGFKAGLMDWQDDWITSQKEMGAASRKFIADVRQELKDFFAESIKMSIKTLFNEDSFQDLSDDFDRVEAELEASANARTTLIFTPEMEEAFARMNQVQVDSSSDAYASQVDAAIEYYTEVERLATTEQDRMAAVYQAQYYEIEKQRLQDIADAGGDAAKIAEINEEANKEILDAKKDFVDEWYEYQLDTITEMNEKTQDTYKNLFDAIGGFFKDMIDSIWEMFLELIAKMIAQDIFNWLFSSSGNGVSFNVGGSSGSGAGMTTTISALTAIAQYGKTAYGWVTSLGAATSQLGTVAGSTAPAVAGASGAMELYGTEASIASAKVIAAEKATEQATTAAASSTLSSLASVVSYIGILYTLFSTDWDVVFSGPGTSTLQILAEYEAGIRSLTKTEAAYYKQNYLGMEQLVDVNRYSSQAMQDYWKDATANHTTFTTLTLSQMDAIKAKALELEMAISQETGALNDMGVTLINATSDEIRVELEKLMADFQIDPSDEWYDLIIQVDAPSSIPVSYGDLTQGMAAGGPVAANTPYIIGEIGPELFVPQSSGNILSNKDMRSLMGIGIKGYASGTATLPGYNVTPYSNGTTDLNMWSDLSDNIEHLDSTMKDFQGIIQDAIATKEIVLPWESDPATHSSGTTEMNMWTDLYKQTRDYLDLLTDLQSELKAINEYYEEQIVLAQELGVTAEELNDIYEMQEAAVAALTLEFVTSYNEYVNEALSLTSDLGAELQDLNQYFIEAIQNAHALGASNAQLLKMLKDWKEIQDELIAQFEDDYQDYVNEMLGMNSDLANSLDEVTEYYEDAIQSAMDAGYSQEQLNQMYAEQAAIIQELTDEYLDNMTQSLQDLRFAMVEWANGMLNTDIDAAIANLMSWLTFENYSINNIANLLNFNGMSDAQIAEYVAQLESMFSSIASTLQGAYEDLKSLNKSISGSIESLQLSILTPEEQSAFYANRAVSSFNSLGSMSIEDQVEALQQIHDDAMAYYDLEKQAIEEKYQTEIDAINEAAESFTNLVSVLDSINDKIQDLKYSSYNLALPKQKAEEAAKDYATLKAAADAAIVSGDTAAINDFLAFTETYLQNGMDAYKSSQDYLDMYAQVQADLVSMGLSIGQKTAGMSVEGLTEIQNGLIEDLNKQMQDEIDTLTSSIIDALGTVQDKSTEIQLTIVDALIDLYELIETTEAATKEALLNNLNSSTRQIVSSIETLGKGIANYWIAFNQEEAARSATSDGLLHEFMIGVGYILTYMYQVESASYSALAALNRSLSIPGFSDGGVASGPASGYPVILHGTEVITPIAKAGSLSGYNDLEIKNLLTALVAQGNKRQNVTLTLENGRELKGYIQATADELDQARHNKKITNRVYR
jgi:hypothetical protein